MHAWHAIVLVFDSVISLVSALGTAQLTHTVIVSGSSPIARISRQQHTLLISDAPSRQSQQQKLRRKRRATAIHRAPEKYG